MISKMSPLNVFYFFLIVISISKIQSIDEIINNYSYAVVESCQGCQLNRLPEVKSFIFEDIPNYKNVEFKHIYGAPPELVLYNEADEEVERLKLSELSRRECNGLLISKGFKKSELIKDEI